MTTEETPKPHIFIGSTTEAEKVANALHTRLSEHADSHLWTVAFPGSQFPLESLTDEASKVDFAVFVASPDDLVTTRDGDPVPAVRDNIWFEMGLFIGALGRRRVFFLPQKGDKEIKIPSDLIGVTYLPKYGVHKDTGRPDVIAAADDLEHQMKTLGPLTRHAATEPSTRTEAGAELTTTAASVKSEQQITAHQYKLHEQTRKLLLERVRPLVDDRPSEDAWPDENEASLRPLYLEVLELHDQLVDEQLGRALVSVAGALGSADDWATVLTSKDFATTQWMEWLEVFDRRPGEFREAIPEQVKAAVTEEARAVQRARELDSSLRAALASAQERLKELGKM